MIITLDYNNDSVSIQNEENDPTVISFNKIKDLKTIQSILVETFNMLPEPSNLLIQRIDEDVQSVIEEW